MIVTLMTGLTILFVVYILYIVFTTLRTGCEDQETSAKPSAASPPKASRAPAAKPAAETKPAAAKAEAAPSEEEIAQVKQFRHPDTGETAAVPTNYRFAKRWIKEAMVKEGLLDRIYKNNELQDDAVNQRVREALDKFKTLKKYWA